MADINEPNLIAKFKDFGEFKKISTFILDKKKIKVQAARRVIPFIIASLKHKIKTGAMLIIVDSERSASQLCDALRTFGIPCNVFPEWETLPHERTSPDPETVFRRMRALRRISQKEVAVCSIRSAMFPVPSPSETRHIPVNIQAGMHLNMEELVGHLIRIGYERAVKVEAPGEIAVRGGLIDISPPSYPNPVRAEFFGNKVESLRYFDPISQSSVKKIQSITIYPSRELILTQEKIDRAVTILKRSEDQMSWLAEDVEKISNGIYFDGIEAYIPFLEKKTNTVFDYLDSGDIIVIGNGDQFKELAKQHFDNQIQYIEEIEESGLIPKSKTPYVKNIFDTIEHAGIATLEFVSFSAGEKDTATVSVEAGPGFLGPASRNRLRSFLGNLSRDKYWIFFILRDKGTLNRMSELLKEAGFDFFAGPGSFEKPGIYLLTGIIHEGFIIHKLKLAIVSQEDVFGGSRVIRRYPFQHRAGIPVTRLSDLLPNDFVVHRTHGIGIFKGLVKKSLNHHENEYMEIEYLGGDKLFVPANSLDRITKYRAGGDADIKITKLGSPEWGRTKQRVRKSVRKLAINLAQLYRERAQMPGFAFAPDAPWQTEIEDSFPYEETTDQAQAIKEVKSDMENSRPTDRLVCGDVGFGKTEVAIRAAFKAVMDGKQVMLLVPTTILARQHYKTFSERMAPFPITIGIISRLVNSKIQKETIEEFNNGRIDILIGTHALLRKSVAPKDLGLAIIDEEHRFGVGQKEKLRLLKKNIDILAMTATPIPRTLQLSLSGIRDLSLIETPPPGRRPINTYIGTYDPALVKAAIRREMARDGQTFYVHNRIEDIYEIKEKIELLVPEARIEVAHGQMRKRELETVMNDFLDHNIDVLLSTSIIEAGIDIPSVNTLIADNAESLGLAQLYQIRGRIGRSFQKAHAYFLVKSSKSLVKAAGERLRTLSELTALGSGLRIALKDLEIRGAGDILGAEQHGHILNVGFDLYTDLLAESVKEEKGEKTREKSEPAINLPVDAYIPQSYISAQELRIEAYRRLAETTGAGQTKVLIAELEDRFGKAPPEVVSLGKICELRAKSEQLGIEIINCLQGKIKVKPIEDSIGKSAANKLNGYYHKAEQAVIISARESEILHMVDKLLDLLFKLSYKRIHAV